MGLAGPECPEAACVCVSVCSQEAVMCAVMVVRGLKGLALVAAVLCLVQRDVRGE